MKFFRKADKSTSQPATIWARPEMTVVFRAEIMPNKNRDERTFRVREVLSNGRVRLYDFSGEHRETEFEPLNFKREKP